MSNDVGDNDHRTPRWVKLFAIIVAILVLAFVALHLTGRGLGNHLH
jgi:hypothetical protein